MVRDQEIQIGIIIEQGGRCPALCADQPVAVVLEIPPGMRAGQENGFAGPIRKISWVGVKNTQWSFGHG